VSGFGLAAGVIALFFACGVLTGVLGVLALSAMRGRRQRQGHRRPASQYARDQSDTLDWTWPRRPSGPDWEDRPGGEEQRRSDEIGELPPPWPDGRRDLTARND
jgi:hypothetical protein